MNISNEQKIYELSLIWSEAKYNFAFWDKLTYLNWDKEYYKAIPRVLNTKNIYEYYLELKRFISLLKDGHTDVWFPHTLNNDPEFTSKLPIRTALVEGKRVVVNVKECVKDKVIRYSVVKKIDGVEINEYIKKNIYPYIWCEKEDSCDYRVNEFITNGRVGSKTIFELEYDNITYEVELTRTKGDISWVYNQNISYEKTQEVYNSNSHRINVTDDNIAIITVDTMENENLSKDFINNIDLFKKVNGYVIDVRNNGGGSSEYSSVIASAFIKGGYKQLATKSPIHIAVYKGWNMWQNFGNKTYEEVVAEYGESDWLEKVYKIPKHIYFEEKLFEREGFDYSGLLTKPLVVLTSPGTASAAEDLLIMLDYNKRATIVGQNSFGSTGQPLFVNLESGGGFRICTLKCTYPDGKEFINIGVKPHIYAELTINDYINGVDSVMNKGLEILREEINK